jgi:hypothetical protein
VLADERFAYYLTSHGYHPRSSKHGNELCRYLIEDLLVLCPHFKTMAKQGKIVYKLNHVVGKGSWDQWNTDLVVGPGIPIGKISYDRLIKYGEPSEIWFAMDTKTIMTEHGKARRNRQRDLDSFSNILHRKNSKTIVAGLIVANIAEKFRSPLRPKVTAHGDVRKLVEEISELLKALAISESDECARGPDALGLIVVSYTNLEGSKAQLIRNSPAPPENDNLNYLVFLDKICTTFRNRYPSAPG